MNPRLQITVLFILGIFGLSLFYAANVLSNPNYQESKIVEPISINEVKLISENEPSQVSEEVINGDMFFINKITKVEDQFKVEIDKIEWLSAADGTCTNLTDSATKVPKCNPNGFLVSNDKTESSTFPISIAATILTTNYGANPEATTLIDATKLFTEQLKYQSRPFTVQIQNGIVTGMQEIYTP
jgi:hypothetical protein